MSPHTRPTREVQLTPLQDRECGTWNAQRHALCLERLCHLTVAIRDSVQRARRRADVTRAAPDLRRERTDESDV